MENLDSIVPNSGLFYRNNALSNGKMQNRFTRSFRFLSALIAGFYIFTCILRPLPVQAQSVYNLPAPSTMVPLSLPYQPAIVKGITLYPDDPLKFDFIVDPGDDNLQGNALQKEANKLIKYLVLS